MDTCHICKQVIQQPSHCFSYGCLHGFHWWCVVHDLNANFTGDSLTAFSCPVCCNPFDALQPLKLLFNPSSQELSFSHHVAAERNPADDHPEPVIGTTHPTAPQRVVPTCCYRSGCTHDRMNRAPYPNPANSQGEIECIEGSVVSLSSSLDRSLSLEGQDLPRWTLMPATGLASVTSVPAEHMSFR